MFDLEAIDRLYEADKACGSLIHWGIFDKRALLSLAQLSGAVKGETGEVIDEEGLRARATEGWFPLLKAFEEGEPGAPLYVPSRVGLLLKLERDGYGADELRVIAELEEWAIDNMYTVDDMAYVDDDLDSVILYAEARLDALEHQVSPSLGDREKAREEGARKELHFLRGLKETGVPERLRPVIEKQAFRTRAFNDLTRVWMLDMERDKIKAGYSPYVECRSQGWNEAEGFRAEDVLWKPTVEGAMAYTPAGEAPPIRVPGFLLRGELVTPTRTLRPADYAALWKQWDIEKYLEVWGQLRGERRCLNCFAQLSTENERKRYCGDKCRNAARQRRFRARNPEAVERNQKRYWDSIEVEGA